jgi:phosphoglycerol transferase MdoB-like AlkP superfamily enzyme
MTIIVAQHYILTARPTTKDSKSSGRRSQGCSYTKLFLHTSFHCWMESIFFALRAKRHRLGPSTYLLTYLVVPVVMKAWVYLAFLSIGSILVLGEIPFYRLFSLSKPFLSSTMALPLVQQGNLLQTFLVLNDLMLLLKICSKHIYWCFT